MKTFKSVLLLAVCLVLASCSGGGGGKEILPKSAGKPYDLLVVIPNAGWDGIAGDSIRAIFQDEVPYLAQAEPLFDVYQVNPANYSGIIKNMRNVFVCEIVPGMAEAVGTIAENVNVSPQIVVTVKAASFEAAAKYISDNRDMLCEKFEAGERKQFLTEAAKIQDKAIGMKVESTLGIKIIIPFEYKIRAAQSDFMWISNEMRLVSQGLIMYKYPLEEGVVFDTAYLVAKRDEFVKRIPGPGYPEVKDSYMITFGEFTPDISTVVIEGRRWTVMRGLWDVKNDFMGGPFVSYTTVLPEKKEVITLEGYVYSPSPQFGKRNYILELEDLISAAKLQ